MNRQAMRQRAMEQQQQESGQQAAPPKYRIDVERIEANGQSLEQMIESRVPDASNGDKPSAKRKKKAVTMADVAKIEGFVNPEVPIMEAVFRLLLVHQNKPLDVEQISQELAERGIGIRDARNVNPEVLVRLLDHDRYYGVVRLPDAN